MSLHSKLLLVDKLIFTVMSLVSFPEIVNGVGKFPVTTQLPFGIGDVAEIGFGTVVPGD
jgi:hypothetical protein